MIFSDKDSQWCRAISDMAQLPGPPIHGGRTKTMKTRLAKLTVDVAVYLEMPDDWPEDVIELATKGIASFSLPGDDAITLEIENIRVDDMEDDLAAQSTVVPEGLPELLEALADRLSWRSEGEDCDQQLMKQARKAAQALRTMRH